MSKPSIINAFNVQQQLAEDRMTIIDFINEFEGENDSLIDMCHDIAHYVGGGDAVYSVTTWNDILGAYIDEAGITDAWPDVQDRMKDLMRRVEHARRYGTKVVSVD